MPATARVVAASLLDGDLEGGAAVLQHGFGDGTAWYVATALDRSGMRAVMRAALDEAGVSTLPGLPPGRRGRRPIGRRRRVLFLLNHGSGTSRVTLPDSTPIVLAPGEVAIRTDPSTLERP